MTRAFEQQFTYYLSIGMSAAEYWYGDSYLTVLYRRANDLRIQRKSEEMWMQGLYIYNALNVVIGNAFRKKGTKARDYISEPIRLTPLTEAEKAAKAEKERRKAIEFFTNLQKKAQKREQQEKEEKKKPKRNKKKNKSVPSA